MSKILVANIGNRTLIEKNHNNKAIGVNPFIAPDGSEHTGSFKQLTKEILCKNWLQMVKINIIDKLIDNHINELEQIFLFVSNQTGDYTQQDTIFAGEIIKKLIISNADYDFSADNIHVIQITESIVEADRLIPTYYKELLKIKTDNSNKTFIFCDSGGTPQQKTSLKIVAEYLFKGKGYEYKQVIQKADYNETLNFEDAVVKTMAAEEYRKVVANENIILLCETGNYQGAKALRLSVTSNSDRVFKALSFLDLRINLLKADAKVLADEVVDRSTYKTSFSSINNYSQETSLGEYIPWQTDFCKKDFFQLCEILSIAQYYLQLNELSNAVITYQIFIENYCAYFIRKQKGNDFDLIDNRATALKELKKELKDNILMIQPYIPVEWTSSKIKVGLPTEIVFCEHVLQGTAKHDAIIQTFKHFHEKLISLAVAGKDGLDSLRNNIAHNGIGVKSITEINNCINGDFEQIVALWHSTFELPLENVYSTSNKEIENFLRNN